MNHVSSSGELCVTVLGMTFVDAFGSIAVMTELSLENGEPLSDVE